jgi:hypothetical protein
MVYNRMMMQLFKPLSSWLSGFYHNHIQTALGTLTAALATFDLVGYHDSVASFTGEKGYHAIRLGAAGVIIWRASQVTREKLSSQPPPGP